MESKIRVGTVSYLNALPLMYGLEKPAFKALANTVYAYPSALAEKLLNHELDVAMVPVETIRRMPQHYIVPGYCIGASSKVVTVCIFSHTPIESIKQIMVDYQSRTSVALMRILLKEFWKISPIEVQGYPGYEKDIQGSTAGLIIGDRAFEAQHQFPYVYDLAEVWQQHTGLPFVFAAWIAHKRLDPFFEEKFIEATGVGLQHLDEIVAANPNPFYDLKTYYTANIDYILNEPKLQALQLFLQKIQQVI